MAKEKAPSGLGVKKSEDISTWYTEVIQKAGLADYTDVSGCIVFRPYAYAMWEKIVAEVDKRIKKMGVKNAYFPLLIPEKLLKKEQAHVKGFSPEVAWVTHAGDSKLDERLAIRPTSETIMYESYKNWIRSWRDLPLKINQWNNVVRWEFKHPVPFLRTREFLWNEGHTVFATKEEAEKECFEILDMYDEVLKDYFALYGVKGKKTEHEKFAGAEYTLSIELFLPNGRAIQGPDAHHDGQNFAKAFGIKFLDQNQKEQFAYQNTWAITTRMIGVMIMVHGDDRGLVLPPKLAPLQIVIVPIFFDDKDKIIKKAKDIKDMLSDYSVELDDRDEYTAGWKFNEYEVKGVPLRIEIGPKDIAKDQVVLVRRDTLKKEFVPLKDLGKRVKETLEDIQTHLYKQSKKMLEENIVEVKDMAEFVKAIENKKLVKALFCGEASCEDVIKDKTGGATSRNIPFGQKLVTGKCVCCGKQAKNSVYFGKGY
ncbi:MAG: proline--tRNA ligase [Nanoarchaeota archaeon]|nr:proline--tRNA ligase [Nanoarchaeota archaeon]MBU1004253.1 proline--tRNA ligase [Nanoarchaeota archaeon]MBU1945413.1 proline--tRNA ligase [Nanoarchaeota archaeon]